MRQPTCFTIVAFAVVTAGSGVAAPAAEASFEQRARELAADVHYTDTVRAVDERSAVATRIEWVPKHVSQTAMSTQPGFEPPVWSDEERAKFANRVENQIELFAAPTPCPDPNGVKARLVLQKTSHPLFRQMVFLGDDGQRAWFAYATVADAFRLQQRMTTAGEPMLPILLRAIDAVDPASGDNIYTRSAAQDLLVTFGKGALSELDAMLAKAGWDPNRYAVMTIGRSNDPEVTAWLIERTESADPSVARAARLALTYDPRPAAAALYKRWLVEDVGRVEVDRLLRACRRQNVTGIEPELRKVLAAPASVRDYRFATELLNELEGRPAMPADLLALEETIRRAGYRSGNHEPDPAKVAAAVEAVLARNDHDNVRAVALSIAVATTKGNFKSANNAGFEILRRLPDGRGIELLERVIASDANSSERDDLKKGLTSITQP